MSRPLEFDRAHQPGQPPREMAQRAVGVASLRATMRWVAERVTCLDASQVAVVADLVGVFVAAGGSRPCESPQVTLLRRIEALSESEYASVMELLDLFEKVRRTEVRAAPAARVCPWPAGGGVE